MFFEYDTIREVEREIRTPKISFSLSSGDCSVAFTSKVSMRGDSSVRKEALIYSIFSTLLACLHFAVIIRILKSLLDNEHENLKYSLYTLAFAFVWDGFLTFI